MVEKKRIRIAFSAVQREKFVTDGKTSDFAITDITWMVHGFKNIPQASWCLQNIRINYPKNRIILMVYGDMDAAWSDVAAKFSAELHQSPEQILALDKGAKVWQERFTVFLEKPTRWLFKIDVDTRINKAFSFMPKDKIAVITNPVYNAFGYFESILGGGVGFPLETVKLFMDSESFLSNCYVDHRHVYDKVQTQQVREWTDQGLIADDNVFNQARRRLGVPLVNHPEMLILGGGSNAKDVDRHFLRQFAITHPHKDITIEAPKLTAGNHAKFEQAIQKGDKLASTRKTSGTEVFFLSHDCWERALQMDQEAKAAGFKTTIIHIPIPSDAAPQKDNVVICNEQYWTAMWNTVVNKATTENVWIVDPYIRLYDFALTLQRGEEVMKNKDVWQYSPFFDCFLVDTFSMLSRPQYSSDISLRVVPYNERSVVCVKSDLLFRVGKIDTDISKRGWGTDSIMGYLSWKYAKKCIRDYRVSGRLMYAEEWNTRITETNTPAPGGPPDGYQEQLALVEAFGIPHIDGECCPEVYDNRLFKPSF